MTGTINGKYRQHPVATPLMPVVTALEPVPFYADLNACPNLAAMSLEWTGPTEEANGAKMWNLPLGTVLAGPLPRRFGIQLLRTAEDSYLLNLVWDRTALAWTGLTRAEIRASCLGELLLDLGSDLHHMLEQPIVEVESTPDLKDQLAFADET